MEKIKILFYTDRYFPDNPSLNFTLIPADPLIASFGLSILRDLMVANRPTNSEAEVCLINRNIGSHAAQKLTDSLLSSYDELWVFGYYQANYQPEDMTDFKSDHGGPNNELTQAEVDVLCEWMKSRGVLITGDHSQRKQAGHTEPGLPLTLGLGRALGHRIPRAGKMRAWDGSPINTEEDSYCTNSPGEIENLYHDKLEGDAEPQHIYISSDETDHNSHPPHELFRGGPLKRIQVFPDHNHEGKLISTPADWPAGFSLPQVIAWGFDHRFSSPHYNAIVSVYDGDRDARGRIVADSTWHHYINMNLRNLPKKGVLEAIGAFYGNMALWLAPQIKRNKIKNSLFPWLANHPRVAEVVTTDFITIGRVAKQVIDSQLSAVEISGLSSLFIPPDILKLPENIVDVIQKLVFGHYIKRYYENNSLADVSMWGSDKAITHTNLMDYGLKEALQSALKHFETHSQTISGVINSLIDVAVPQGVDRSDRYENANRIDVRQNKSKEDITVSQFDGEWSAELRLNIGGGPILIEFDIRDIPGTTDVNIFFPPPPAPVPGGPAPVPAAVGKTRRNFISFTLNVMGVNRHFYGAYRLPIPGETKVAYIEGVFVNGPGAPPAPPGFVVIQSDDGGWVGSLPRS